MTNTFMVYIIVLQSYAFFLDKAKYLAENLLIIC